MYRFALALGSAVLVSSACGVASNNPAPRSTHDAGGAMNPPIRPAEAREVSFSSSDATPRVATLEGTLTLPERQEGAQHPAVILLHGSGPNSRDATLTGQLNMAFGFELDVFRLLAERFAEAGYITLRYDKRSCGRFNSCGENDYPIPGADTSPYDVIADAEGGVDFLLEQAAVDPSRVYAVGHSQGAAFLPHLLTQRTAIRAGVMLAGNYRPIDQIVAQQLADSRALLEEAGATSGDRRLQPLVEAVGALGDLREEQHDGSPILGAPSAYWEGLFHVGDERPALVGRLDRPLLAIGGDYDWNVPPREIEAWRDAFAEVPNDPGHAATVVPCVTHALNCITQPDYRLITPSDIGRTVDESLMHEVLAFLSRQAP